MIATSIVQEIRRLLVEEQLSQRKVARMTGISRGTIGRIASGQRPDYLETRRVEEWPEISGPPQRCPSCGGRVYMPCRLCSVRNRIAGKTRRSVTTETTRDTGLALDLPPELHARYELIHRCVTVEPRNESFPENLV